MAGTQATINLSDLNKRLRKLTPELQRAMHKGLVEGANRIVAQVQQEIETTSPHKPVDTGAMAAGYRARRTARGAMVVSSVPQALWIERGRRPGPVSAEGRRHLADWVRRKHLYLEELANVMAQHHSGESPLKRTFVDLDTGKVKRRTLKRAAIDEACDRVAFAIARKLASKGYAPRYPLKRAIKSSRRAVLEAVRTAMHEVSV